MIASSRERSRSVCPVSRRSFGRIVPSDAGNGITTRDSTESSKAKLQAFGPPSPKSLQIQNPSRPENRLSLNGLDDCSRTTTDLAEFPVSSSDPILITDLADLAVRKVDLEHIF